MGFAYSTYKVNVPKVGDISSNKTTDVDFSKINVEDVEVLEDFSDEKISVPVEVYDYNINNDKVINSNETYRINKNDFYADKERGNLDLSYQKELEAAFLKGLKRTGATVGVFGLSIIEGGGTALEELGDAAITLSSAIATPFTFLADKTAGLFGKETDFTGELWDSTKAIVSKDIVKSNFDNFYKTTGKGLKENAYFFDETRSLGNTAGYVGAVIGLSMASGVVVPAKVGLQTQMLVSPKMISSARYAATAGILGMGEGSQNSWQKGASTVEGLNAGLLNAELSASQWYFGAKVGKSTLSGPCKSALAGAIGMSDVPGRAAIDTTFNKKEYSKNFSEHGGFVGMTVDGVFAASFMGAASYVDYRRSNFIDLNSVSDDALKAIQISESSNVSQADVSGFKTFENNNLLTEYFDEFRSKAPKKMAENVEDEVEPDVVDSIEDMTQ